MLASLELSSLISSGMPDLGEMSIQDDGKGGLSLRGVAFMTVLAVLAVLESTLPSFCLSNKNTAQCDGFGGFGGNGGFDHDSY